MAGFVTVFVATFCLARHAAATNSQKKGFVNTDVIYSRTSCIEQIVPGPPADPPRSLSE